MKFLQIINNFLYFFTKKAVHNTNCTEPGTIPHCGFTCYLLYFDLIILLHGIPDYFSRENPKLVYIALV